jgi:membrane protease subunit HflK
VLKPKVTQVKRVEVGFRSGTEGVRGQTGTREIVSESLMLTGDENIIYINFTVFWVIKDAGKYLFAIRDADETVKDVAESAMREVIGRTPIASALAEGRQLVEQTTFTLIQEVLDFYGAGIQVTQVELQKVDPPAAVIDSFRDVQRARADQERLQNEAEAYRNDVIPRARGEAARLEQEAEAYKQEVLANAQGQTSRFLSVLEEYAQAKDVTRQRIYIETMEGVLRSMNKVIIDTKGGGQSVVPYLPLPELQKKTAPTAAGVAR